MSEITMKRLGARPTVPARRRAAYASLLANRVALLVVVNTRYRGDLFLALFMPHRGEGLVVKTKIPSSPDVLSWRPTMQLRIQCLERQLCSDRDRRFQGSIDRTSVGKESVNAVGGFSVRLLGFQFQDHMDAADHEHVIL